MHEHAGKETAEDILSTGKTEASGWTGVMENLRRESRSVRLRMMNCENGETPCKQLSSTQGQCAQNILCSVRLFPNGQHSRKQAYPRVPMIGRKNSAFPLSPWWHVTSVLLESRKVVALSWPRLSRNMGNLTWLSIRLLKVSGLFLKSNAVQKSVIVPLTLYILHLTV